MIIVGFLRYRFAKLTDPKLPCSILFRYIIPQNFGLLYISRRRKKNNNKKEEPPFLWVFKRKSLTVNMKKLPKWPCVFVPFCFLFDKNPKKHFPFFLFPILCWEAELQGRDYGRKRKYALQQEMSSSYNKIEQERTITRVL